MTESQQLGTLPILKFWIFEIFEILKILKFEFFKCNPWDMPSNFCFHVWAQKSQFKVENAFFSL